MRIRIATRNSPLALWQAEYVKSLIENASQSYEVEIIGMTTKGDQILDRSLLKVGGKGLFMKELEEALLDGRADIAVHSMKDVTLSLPEGLSISVVCEREKPNDAFVSNNFYSLNELPDGANVGTSSLRRVAQLKHHFPKLNFRELRGNVNTRLAKLDNSEYDAIVLASAGLIRLGLAKRIRQHIPTDICLPAVGQGIVGIETREMDSKIIDALSAFNNKESTICLAAERSVNQVLDGGCSVPIAAHAILDQGNKKQLSLTGLVGDVESGHIVMSSESIKFVVNESELSEVKDLGKRVAENLKSQGALELIDKSLAFSQKFS